MEIACEDILIPQPAAALAPTSQGCPVRSFWHRVSVEMGVKEPGVKDWMDGLKGARQAPLPEGGEAVSGSVKAVLGCDCRESPEGGLGCVGWGGVRGEGG